jgi:hypothetical protein
MLENPPFFPKDTLINSRVVNNLQVIYQEWALTTRGNPVPRATTKGSGEVGDTYIEIKIVVREIDERTLIFEAVKKVTLSISLDTPSTFPLWNIQELPLYKADMSKVSLLDIKTQYIANRNRSIRAIYKLIKKYGLTEFDSYINIYIHKGLEDIFKRLMFKMGKEIKLLETWEIGSKYRVITPNILEVMHEIDEARIEREDG